MKKVCFRTEATSVLLTHSTIEDDADGDAHNGRVDVHSCCCRDAANKDSTIRIKANRNGRGERQCQVIPHHQYQNRITPWSPTQTLVKSIISRRWILVMTQPLILVQISPVTPPHPPQSPLFPLHLFCQCLPHLCAAPSKLIATTKAWQRTPIYKNTCRDRQGTIQPIADASCHRVFSSSGLGHPPAHDARCHCELTNAARCPHLFLTSSIHV